LGGFFEAVDQKLSHKSGFEGARLHRLRKKPEKQVPRELKPARDDKNKELSNAPKGAPLQDTG
jgi:hypothetical protein